MPEKTIQTYEGFFLFPQTVTADLRGAVEHLNQLLERAEVEIISLRKWDERKLAYDIKGNKRGVYFLVYFKAATDALQGLERSCNLSEQILRSMVIRADHLSQEQIEAADGRQTLEDEIKLRDETPAEEAPAEEAPAETAAT
jgi:small subunit ribosomal protein S6